MPLTATFASLRAEQIVVERRAVPIFSEGRQIGVEPGKYHRFTEHRCKVEGQRAIDFMRDRMKDGLEIWEIDASDVPPVNALLAELATADIERVREILAAESDGPARAEVIDVAKAVLERAGVAERKPGGQKPERTRHETVTA